MVGRSSKVCPVLPLLALSPGASASGDVEGSLAQSSVKHAPMYVDDSGTWKGFATSLSDLTVLQTVQHVYVSATGSDAAAGSQAAPKATIAGAWALLPANQTAPFVLHLGAGTFTWTEPPEVVQSGPNAFVVVVGDATTVQTTGTFNSSAVDATHGLPVWTVTPGAAMTTDQWSGYTLQITSGTYNNWWRTIMENTPSTITLAGGVPPVTAGTTYTIHRNASIINMPARFQHNINVHFVRVALTASMGTFSHMGNVTRRDIYMFGVEFKTNVRPYVYNASWFAGFSNTSNTKDIPYLVITAAGFADGGAGQGWGISTIDVQTAGQGMSLNHEGRFYGYCVIKGLIIASSNSRSLCYGRAYGLNASFSSIVTMSAGILDAPSDFSYPVVSATYDSRVEIGALYVKQNNPSMYCISLRSGTLVMIGTLTVTSAATTQPCIYSLDGTILTASGTASLTGGCGYIYALGNSTISLPITVCTGQLGNSLAGIQVENNSRVMGEFSLQSTGIAVLVRGPGATFRNASASMTGNGSAVVYVDKCGTVEFAYAMTLTNNNTGTADGVRALGGGRVYCGGNLTTNLSASAGYGINVTGGGQVTLQSQPTAVVGPTADLCVGPDTSDRFADTVLQTAFSSVSRGAACIQRAA